MTKRMEWIEGFRVGHADIDRDHKNLVDRLNRIVAGFAEGRGEAAYRECLAFRGDIGRHFDKENRILRNAAFPRCEAHARAHGEFVDRLSAYCAACGERCRKSEKEACLTDLSDMLVDHFLKGGMDFKSHLEYMGLANGKSWGQPEDPNGGN